MTWGNSMRARAGAGRDRVDLVSRHRPDSARRTAWIGGSPRVVADGCPHGDAVALALATPGELDVLRPPPASARAWTEQLRAPVIGPPWHRIGDGATTRVP